MTQPRIGLMVPINNTTLARELADAMPEALLTTLRIPRGQGLLTAQTLPAYQGGALKLAQRFADQPVDVVGYGCTAAGFIGGPAADRALAAELAAITGAPVVTTARSMVLELQRVGARSIALVTPYLDEVNACLKSFLEEAGIRVRRFDSLYAADVDVLGSITPEQVEAIARTTMDDGCDAMFIACAQLPTRTILAGLQEAFGRPVISANAALTAQLRGVLAQSAAEESARRSVERAS